MPGRRSLHRLGWHEFEGAVAVMADAVRRVSPLRRPFGVYGQPRGGLCLAVALSHELRLPLLQWPTAGMLWVDDIVDSGLTFRNVLSAHTPAIAAAWFWDVDQFRTDLPETRCLGVAAKAAEAWYVFPWESADDAEREYAAYCARRP